MGLDIHLYKDSIILGLELLTLAGSSAFAYSLHRMTKNLDRVLEKYDMKSS